MRKFNKLLCLAMALCVCVIAVSGCGKKDNNAGKNGAPYEISWYYISPTPQTDIANVETAINDYLKGKINATVKLNGFDWGMYGDKVSNMIAGGDKFDMLWIDKPMYDTNVPRGSFMDITELMDTHAPKTKELIGEEFIEGAKVDGKLYAVQANKDKAHHFGFVYRKDIVGKYNLDMSQVKTFKDMFAVYDVISKNEPDMVCLGMGDGVQTTTLLDFDSVNDIAAFYDNSTDGKIVNKFETPEYKEALLLAREAYQKGYIYKDAITAKNLPQQKKQGTVFSFMNQLKVGKLDEINAAYDHPYDEIALTTPKTSIHDVVGSMVAISRTCKNPEVVMQFIELFNTDKYLNNLINFGIEGKHYEKINENVIRPIKNSGYDMVGMQWMFGNIFENYLMENEEADKFDKLNSYNESSRKSYYMGFFFDPEPVKVEAAACKNVIKEYQESLEYGVIDPEVELSRFISKLKQAGSDEIMNETNRQYKSWAEKNGKNYTN